MRKVLDASAFINASMLEKAECFTTPDVIAELKDIKSKSLAEVAIGQGMLSVRSPSPESIRKVIGKALDVGSEKILSTADLSVMALALELDAVVVTDDWTLQNLAAHFGIPYEGVFRGTIKEKRTFKR
jgi:UPF0271 protein